MKKLFNAIKLIVRRKSIMIDTLVNALENVDNTLTWKRASGEEKVESIQNTMFLTKVNLKWLTGVITRDEYEDIYRREPHDYINHPELIGDLIKSIQYKNRWRYSK